MLNLKLDDYKKGLRALNNEGEVILLFRRWRDQLIGKDSFDGTNANIAKLEGCDLILRTDYFNQLKKIIPDLVFYSQVVGVKQRYKQTDTRLYIENFRRKILLPESMIAEGATFPILDCSAYFFYTALAKRLSIIFFA